MSGVRLWLEDWSGAFQLAASLLLVAITGWYAWLTRALTRSAVASAESARRSAEVAAQSLMRQSLDAKVDIRLVVVHRGLTTTTRTVHKTSFDGEEVSTAEGEANTDAGPEWLSMVALSSQAGGAFIHSLRAVNYLPEGADADDLLAYRLLNRPIGLGAVGPLALRAGDLHFCPPLDWRDVNASKLNCEAVVSLLPDGDQFTVAVVEAGGGPAMVFTGRTRTRTRTTRSRFARRLLTADEVQALQSDDDPTTPTEPRSAPPPADD